MRPNQSAAPPSVTNSNLNYFSRSHQQPSSIGPTLSAAGPSGKNSKFVASEMKSRVQDIAVRPLQSVCDQSVVSIQIDDSRVSTHQQIQTDNMHIESSMMGENIQDSAMDFQLQIPSAFRGAAKVLDNQQSISVISQEAAPVTGKVQNQQQQSSSRQDKQTTIKKLNENQKNLFKKCSSVLKEVNIGMTESEQKMASCAQQYSALVRETQQVEYQLETLIVKYTMTKQSALSDIYNLTQQTSLSSSVQRPADTLEQSAGVTYSKEQQVLILGLLRFKVLTPEHFHEIFADASAASLKGTERNNPSQNFVDTKRDVPFGGMDVDTNPKMAKLSPAFEKLEEMNQMIRATRSKLKKVEQKKSAALFKRTAETKRIGHLRGDKRELLDLINQLQTNLKELMDRKTDTIARLLKKNKSASSSKDEISRIADHENLVVSDYLVGKVLYTEKKVLEAIHKLFFVKDAVRKGKKWQTTSDDENGTLLSNHLRQTMASRVQIETEFMKKKIHFVSEFKLYGDDVKQSFQQAMQAANQMISPPAITRNHKPDEQPLTSRKSQQTQLGALISGRSKESMQQRYESKTTENVGTYLNSQVAAASSSSPRKVGLSARNQESTPNYISNRKVVSHLGQFQQRAEKTLQSPNPVKHQTQQAQCASLQPAGDLTVSLLLQKQILSQSNTSAEETKNMGSNQNSLLGRMAVGSASNAPSSNPLSRDNSGVRIGGPQKNNLLKNLSVERLRVENDDKMEPRFESDGGSNMVDMSDQITQKANAFNPQASSRQNKVAQSNQFERMRSTGLGLGSHNPLFMQGRSAVNASNNNPLVSEHKKFERAPGCSEGLDKKAADQSVQMGDSMNDSIQLNPLFVDMQQSSRRNTNKLMKNQSDEPADQSDEDRGEEIDIEELKIGDIALQDPLRQQQNTARRNHTYADNNNYNAAGGVKSGGANSSDYYYQQQQKKKCASLNDDLSQNSLRSNGTHNGYGGDSQINYEPVLDSNALTKKTSINTEGRPPRHNKTKQDSVLDSSNSLSTKSKQAAKNGPRKQPRSMKMMGSPDRRTTSQSLKGGGSDKGAMFGSHDKRETHDSLSAENKNANGLKQTIISAKTKQTQLQGCFSCFCLPNKFQSPPPKREAASQQESNDGDSGFKLEKKQSRQ